MSIIDEISKCLHGFSSDIESCLSTSDWQGLSRVLEARQAYLERILPAARNSENGDSIRELVMRVIEEDKESQATILEQQARLLELNSQFEQGRQAIKAYTSRG